MENQNFNPYQHQQNDNFVIQQNLPNSTAVLVLGILSILGCCCYGIIGLILGIVGLVLSKKDLALYNTNPSLYKGLSNLKTGKILCIIGIVLSIIAVIINIYVYAVIGIENYEDMMMEWSQSLQEDTM
nr:CCC motif membrane protein [uncultured Flavobacterium sp.]